MMRIFNNHYLYKVTWNYYNHGNRLCSVIQYLTTDKCTQSYAYNMLDDKYRNDTNYLWIIGVIIFLMIVL